MGVVVVRVGSVAVAVLLPGMDVAVGVRLAGRVAGPLHLGTSHHIGLHRLPPVLRSYTRWLSWT